MTFSKRIVFVYTLIVTIPLFLLVIFIFSYVRRQSYARLAANCRYLLEVNTQEVAENAKSFDLLEQMINGNNALIFLFAVPESATTEDLIDTIRTSSTAIERTLDVLPQVFGLRIFTNNPKIPERWPVILQSTRTNLDSLSRWEFDYSADFLGNLAHLSEKSLCTTRPIRKNNIPVGYLQISMKMRDFFPFLFTEGSPHESDCIFNAAYNLNGELTGLLPVSISGAREDSSPLEPEEIQQLIADVRRAGPQAESGLFRMKHKFSRRYCAWSRINGMGIILVHITSLRGVQKDLFFIELLLILGLVFTIFALFFIIHAASSRLLGGVYSLMTGMKQVRDGNYNVSIPETSGNEVGQAQKTFNAMTAQIRSQIQQITAEQRLIAETEMKAMQNQINAHFLYNILETIKMQAVIANEDDIAESLTVLGKLMHYCLRWKVHIVTLSQEIDYIRSYIYLLNLRNDYVISLRLEIPEEFMGIDIPKMILQPVVENAFVHGIEPQGKDSVVSVYAEPDAAKAEKLWLCVQDSGSGISASDLARIRAYLADDNYEKANTGSIGLKNIQQRLTLLYGAGYRMEVSSGDAGGVLVRIPIKLTLQ